MQKKRLELLAPAGSMEALIAAISAGADAVYLGSALFGARQSAGFDEEALRQAVELAHTFGVSVHVTLNTLIKQEELPAAREMLSFLQSLHVDGVLVQDLGILFMCQHEFPSLPIHASTQMALHNVAGALFLQKHHVKRIVLARESTLCTIEQVANTGIETEVFAHGALCVSVSGQCLFSSTIGGRSGNRGRCAQPCRMLYTYKGMTKAWLSPADLNTLEYTDQMVKKGVYSFKIEGRLKRPEYVYVVAKAYRKALDQAKENRFTTPTAKEQEALTQIFSRGGFTTGYIGNTRDAGIMYPNQVTPLGVLVGHVKQLRKVNQTALATVLTTKNLNNQDGLNLSGQTVIYSGLPVKNGEIATLRLHHPVPQGTAVYRTENEEQLSNAREHISLKALYNEKSIPIDAKIVLMPEKQARLTVKTAQGITSTVEGEVVGQAQKAPLTKETIAKSLQKTGNTPFSILDMDIQTENAFYPTSALNELRRNALQALHQALLSQYAFDTSQPKIPYPAFQTTKNPNRLIVQTSDALEISSLLKQGAAYCFFAPETYDIDALTETLPHLKTNCALVLPYVIDDVALLSLHAFVHEHHLPVVLNNVGQLGIAWEVPIITGSGIPVANANTKHFLVQEGAIACTLSGELSAMDLLDMQTEAIESILQVYGRTRLMTLTHCPECTFHGRTVADENCPMCGKGKMQKREYLIDRKNVSYPLFPTKSQGMCHVALMSSTPLHLMQAHSELQQLTTSYLLVFTDESQQERRKILQQYSNYRKGNVTPPVKKLGTVGRFLQSVE